MKEVRLWPAAKVKEKYSIWALPPMEEITVFEPTDRLRAVGLFSDEDKAPFTPSFQITAE